jgi:Ni/Co efflux regulator RcnB
MRMEKLLLLVLLAGFLAGCGARHFEYRPASEIPEGPGMFSGKDGEFVLYSDKKEARPAAMRAPEDAQEFRDFQEFKRWKDTDRDSAEYREFQEWREWKEYRAWKERTR